MNKWKAQSEAFRQAMRAMKGGDETTSGSNFNPSQAPSKEVYDDRVECKFCGRKFNETAAERHIPVCEKKNKEMLIKNKGKAAPAKQPRATSIGFKR